MSALAATVDTPKVSDQDSSRRRTTHIPVLDPIRGIAALAVCSFHFITGTADVLPPVNPIRQVAAFGWLGVTAFFVVSGFIIPYSLFQRASHAGDAVGFFARRLKRLEPPYLASILLVLCLQWLSEHTPGFRGEPWPYSMPQLLAHLGYLNAVIGYPWINVVYWTLAIELQFYIFCAVAFPLISSSRLWLRLLSLVAMGAAGLVGPKDVSFLTVWLPLFALGICAFHAFCGLLSPRQFVPLFLALAVSCAWSVGWLSAVVGAATALTILICGTRPLPRALAPIAWVGTISYSLYLTHVPIGGRVINLSLRLPGHIFNPFVIIFMAFVVSIMAAYVFWYVIERPSQRWSKGASKRTRDTVGDSVSTLGTSPAPTRSRYCPFWR